MGTSEANRRWKEKNKDYFKQYRAANREKLLQQDKDYYAANKDEINEQRRVEYAENEVTREQIKETQRGRYSKHKQRILDDNKRRAKQKRERIYKVALHYGCQNPSCKWDGEFIPSQLEFHHLQAGEKEYNVSGMCGRSDDKIAAEINKCCVLCACCHVAVTVGAITYDGPSCCVNESLEPQGELL